MIKGYVLLKDLPSCPKGEIFDFDTEYVGESAFSRSQPYGGSLYFNIKHIENNPDWFKEVKPFVWTDDLVREYINKINLTYFISGLNTFSIEEFKKSKQSKQSKQ